MLKRSPETVIISLSHEAGKDGTFKAIVESTENDGSYAWKVTGPVSVNCVLKIEPLNDTSKGTCQGLFSIIDPQEDSTDEILVKAGWNLAGLKSDQAKTIDAIISGNKSNFTSVWKWENGAWAVCFPGQEDDGAAYAQSKGFGLLSIINPKEGFWVNCIEDITLD